jgi:hypothetical protein
LKPAATWARPFDDPILLPGGRELLTLRDAADYIMKLPKADQQLDEWQTAIECLIGATEGRDFVMHSRIGVLRALNCNVERMLTDRKEMHLGAPEAQVGPTMTVLLYVNTSKRFGDPDHLKVFANVDAAETWFEKNDPEGVAFEYEVLA